MASYGHYSQNWAGSDFLHPIHWAWFWQNATSPLPVSHQTRLCSSTDSLYHTVQNQPRSCLVLADCQIWAIWIWSWKLAGVLESLGPLLAHTSKVIWIRCESDLVYLLGKWYGEGWLEAWWCCCCCLAHGKCETVVGQLAAGPDERKPELVTCACDKCQPLDESLCGKECTDDFFCYALCF